MIEEAMLAANVCAAELLSKAEIPALYRVHEGPAQERLENLRSYLGEMGLTLTGGDQPTPADYQKLLSSIGERPDAHIIQSMMLRSMAQAQYRPDNEGHFGLAYSAYTHFTSPIRRYPDLLVHRAIRALIAKNEGGNVKKHAQAANESFATLYPYDMNAMLQAGEQCSMTERRSDEATRDVVAWLKCEFLRHHVGDEFDGTVATVTSFGLFIELKDLFIEGLAHISNLSQDYYHFDQTKQRLVAEHSGTSFNLGDSVRVKVARVDLDERKIDLELVTHESRKVRTRAAKPAAEKSTRSTKGGAKAKSKGGAKPTAKARTGAKAKDATKPGTRAKVKPAVKSDDGAKPKSRAKPKSSTKPKSNNSSGRGDELTSKPRRRKPKNTAQSEVAPKSRTRAKPKAAAAEDRPAKVIKPKKASATKSTVEEAQPAEKKRRWWHFGRG